RYADAHLPVAAMPLHQLLDQAEELLGGQDEAALRFGRRLPAELAGLVEHRQQSHADAGGTGGREDTLGQFAAALIRTAGRIVMQIVELRDRRVAVLQQLDIELGRDRLYVVG